MINKLQIKKGDNQKIYLKKLKYKIFQNQNNLKKKPRQKIKNFKKQRIINKSTKNVKY